MTTYAEVLDISLNTYWKYNFTINPTKPMRLKLVILIFRRELIMANT
jgi:hypothetical protein